MTARVNDCTSWDNSHIFSSLEDPKIESLIRKSTDAMATLEPEAKFFDGLDSHELDAETIKRLQTLLCRANDIYLDVGPIDKFATGILSRDAKCEKARELQSRLYMLFADLDKLMVPADAVIRNVSDATLKELLDHDEVANWAFSFARTRALAPYALSNSEERIVEGLSLPGLHAWGDLYENLAGQLECDVGGETLGLASASALLRQGDRKKREQAWRAIASAWTTHEESASAILNSLNGWRIELNKIRSSKKPFDHLDQACHDSHITRKTLDCLMATTFDRREVGQRAIRAMAKPMGIKRLAPWDTLAPAPRAADSGKVYGFKESIDLISEAFGRLHPSMGDFVQMMHKKNWIDAGETENRSPGAFCMMIPKPREPRVFITFQGSMGDVITLAHELGHAYHGWVMRDLHVNRTGYGMSKAETASIFGETLVKDYLFETSQNDADKMEISWQDAEAAGAMLCNIPARYEFERRMVEKRRDSVLIPSQLKEMMRESWEVWYQDSLSEYDEMFWASKGHFSISELGFYKFSLPVRILVQPRNLRPQRPVR